MKKILAIILSAMIVCAASGCASNSTASDKDATQAATTAAEAVPEATAATADPAVSKDMEQTIEQNEFEGVVYAVENGKPVASYAKGTLENGKEITLDSPMPLGSVSKQFCAAAIMLLRDQGKLSVSDTLDKYYPDYAEGKKLSLHNLLSMRSGIPELTEENSGVVKDNATEEENVASIKKWLFSQPLMFEPDSEFVYTNTNFFLLADIVEQVSGKKYVDFLSENFFEPLGMTHTGSIIELDSSPSWAQGNIYNDFQRRRRHRLDKRAEQRQGDIHGSLQGNDHRLFARGTLRLRLISAARGRRRTLRRDPDLFRLRLCKHRQKPDSRRAEQFGLSAEHRGSCR